VRHVRTQTPLGRDLATLAPRPPTDTRGGPTDHGSLRSYRLGVSSFRIAKRTIGEFRKVLSVARHWGIASRPNTKENRDIASEQKPTRDKAMADEQRFFDFTDTAPNIQFSKYKRKHSTFPCKVCKQTKPRLEMRVSSKGRILHHCKQCKGSYRCIHCNMVKNAERFKSPTNNQRSFDDGEPIRIAVCYTCDYKLNKPRYRRYDLRVQSDESLRSLCMNCRQRWREKTADIGDTFNLTYEYLIGLFEEQDGRCYYSGQPILLERGRSRWNSASLDRKDPLHGYIRGNVVWTTRLVNVSKGQRTAEEFIEFCKSVVEYQGPKSLRISERSIS
jgi:hypothetical protein